MILFRCILLKLKSSEDGYFYGGNPYAIICHDCGLETIRLPQVASTKQAKIFSWLDLKVGIAPIL